jgi:tetraacyldisaccharide 4'-kinase
VSADSKSPSPSKLVDLLLSPPAALFGAIARARGVLFERGILKSIAVRVPVVSIGNLTAGGTGKTPITSFLTREITARGISCGIVSRGYGGEISGPALVDGDGSVASAKLYGDEPSWLSATHRDVPVVVGGDRVADVQTLLDHKKVQLVLADDGFQHRRLKRDLDIVIIDATEPQWHYRPLPQGRMREGFEALSRAKFVILSKVNQAPAEQLAWIRARVQDAKAKHGFTVLEFETKLSGFVKLEENRPDAQAEPNPFADRRGGRSEKSKLVLMSAIARPQVFEQMVVQQTSGEIADKFEFRDHHLFTQEDLAKVEARAGQLKARAIVVTEKDATKLQGWKPKVPCYVSRLIAGPTPESSAALQEFYETIDRLVR